MATFSVVSLGCPKNLTDTENITAILQANGYRLVGDDRQPEIIILNTCGFIEPAIEESTDEIKRLLKLRRSGKIKKLIVAGCLVQRFKKIFAERFPEVDAFVGVAGQEEILRIVEENSRQIEPLPQIYRTMPNKTQLTLPHTAYLKISDGCNHHCSFCTIPQIRGAYRSRPIDDIIKEANYMVEKGVKEITLIGQDTTSYGIDLYDTYKIIDLLKRLVAIPGNFWLRIMYAYPETVTPELIALIAGEEKICKYLDMPIQHIADRILGLMRRPTSGQEIRAVIAQLKNSIPDIALRTTIIAGFPGESQSEYNELLKFVKEVEFSKLGIFAYWQEKGTQAASMPNQVPTEVKEARVQQLIVAQSEVVNRSNECIKGKTMTLLCDTINYGRTQYQAPDIDGGVVVRSGKLPVGDFAQIKITGAEGYHWKGDLAT